MCSVEKCVPLGAELQVWNRDVNLPLRETTTHSSVVAEDRWLSLSNASPLRHSIAKLDVNHTGKGGATGTALLIHETRLHINSAPFHGKQTYARGGTV